ncbi:MAG TPA: DUF692 domain-containing protein [Planctomycetaceae bacterium]|nr:DUF692 domain-containing protein [Planctomycetaceae bacterium]
MFPAIGYAIREQNRTLLGDSDVDAAEITFERADDPLRIARYIGDDDFAYVSVHALKLSVASPDPPGLKYLSPLKDIAHENGACAISDHLGFTRDGEDGIELPHFAPPPFTPTALDAVCRNIEFIQTYFGDLPFFVENIAYFFRFEGVWTEAEFLARVLQRTGCGLLLDVTNVYANALNHGYDPHEFIAETLDAAERVQMHLAGGHLDQRSGLYIDSHSRPVPQSVWDLYRYALELAGDKVEAVFLERDQNYPGESEWRREIRQARRIAEERGVRS